MLIGLCLASLVMSVVLALLTRQQRFYSQLSDMLSVRTSLRDGADILGSDLRTVSVLDTVQFASDTAVEFFSIIGGSTLCADPAGGRLTVPPDTLQRGRVLTAWSVLPDTGDYVTVYHDSTPSAPVPGWQRLAITAVTTRVASSACVTSASVPDQLDLATGSRAYDFTVSAIVAQSVARGTPVRFLRRVRYSVYRGSDRKWYLGYRRCGQLGCAGIQPVSGPYDASVSSALELRYYSASGARIAVPSATAQIARVDVTLRASFASTGVLPATASAGLRDSVVGTIAPRNGQ